MLDLGTLFFGLDVNTRSLTAARDRVLNFGKSVETAQRAASQGADSNIAAFRRQENAITQSLNKLKGTIDRINKQPLSPEIRTTLINDATRSYNNLTKAIGQTGKVANSTKFDRSLSTFNSSLREVNTQAANFGRSISQANRAAASSSSAAEKAQLRQANAIARATEQARNLAAQIERAGLGDKNTTKLSLGLDGALAGFRTQLANPLDARGFSQATNVFNSHIGSLRRNFQGLRQDMRAPAVENWRAWQGTLQNLGSSALILNGHLGGMSTRMFALSTLVSNVGLGAGIAAGAFLGLATAVFGVGKAAIDASLKIEKVTKALTAVSGSQAAANIEFEFVIDVANQAGVSIDGLSRGYTRFLAASQAAGQTQVQTREQFRAISLAAGTLSLSVDDTVGVIRALEQILSKGTVQAEELRGQLGDRFPGAFQIAAKAIGATTEELNDLLKKGEVISKDFVPSFVEALTQEYNINVTEDIDTLQASLERAGTATTLFSNTFAESTGVANAYKAAVDLFTSSIIFLTDNMEGIVRTTVELTGAVFGAVAAYTALLVVTKVSAAITAVGAATRALTIATAGAKTITEAYTLAMAALSVAMNLNPIGALISLVVRLIAIIGGAVLGYNLLTDAVYGTNAAMADTSGIEKYIEQQNAALRATNATTQSMIDQIKVQGETLASQITNKLQEASDLENNEGRTVWADDLINGTFDFQQGRRSGAEVRKERADEIRKEADELIVESRRLVGLYEELDDILDRQNSTFGQGGVSAPATPAGKTSAKAAAKEAKINIAAVEDQIAAFTSLQDKMAVLSEGPEAFKIQDNLAEVRKELGGLSEKELVAASAAMENAGLKIGTLSESLAALKNSTQEGNDSLQTFASAWETINKAVADTSANDLNISLIASGESSDFVESLTQAREALKGLNSAEALTAIDDKLRALGFEAATTEEALAKLFRAVTEGETQAAGLENARKSIADLRRETAQAEKIQRAYNISLEQGFAAERAASRENQLADFAKSLGEVTSWTDEARKSYLEYAQALSQREGSEDALQATRAAAEETRRLWQDVSRSATDGFIDIVTGAQSLEDSVVGVFENISRRILEDALDDLVLGLLDSIFNGNGAEGAQQEAAAKTANAIATSANTAAIAASTTSLLAFQATLAAVSANAAAGSSAGGGGGLLGAISSLVGTGAGALFSSIGGGGINLDPQAAAAIPLSNVTPLGRAFGGPMTEGIPYRINEPGVGGEIFIPPSSGAMTPLSSLGSSNVISIDARMHIDARGATKDSLPALKEEMKANQKRLESAIPSMIDARIRENQFRGR